MFRFFMMAGYLAASFSVHAQSTSSTVIGPAQCSLTYAELKSRFNVYDLTPGTIGYVNQMVNGNSAGVVLTNRSGQYLQIDSVHALPSPAWIDSGARDSWGEYCVQLNHFDLMPGMLNPAARGPGQHWMGTGEVGCKTKKASEDYYSPMIWGTPAQPTALAVPPGSCVLIGGSKYYDFLVKTSRESLALFSVRQPIVDTIFTCNGQTQTTPVKPWRNDTGREIRLVGASIYAVDGIEGTSMSNACITVRDTAGVVRANYCSPAYPVNSRGELALPLTIVQPGWTIDGHASHTCTSGMWDWAAFLHAY